MVAQQGFYIWLQVQCAATDSSGTTSKSIPVVTPKSGQVEVTFQPGGGASGIAGTVAVLCLATPRRSGVLSAHHCGRIRVQQERKPKRVSAIAGV